MAYAFRISDLARTLAQYPTVVTVMGNKIDVRTKEQLATLSSEITALEKLAAEGDTAISAGKSANADGLSSRLSSSADQISSTLSAFAAQDTERLKSMSVVSRNKFNGYATSRLQAEKRFADEISKLLTQEAKTVAGLGKSETVESDTKADSTPAPKPEEPTKPQPEPSQHDVIADLPGYLQATYPDEITGYDPDQLSALCTSSGNTAIKLGAKTTDGVTNFVVASAISGQDLQKQDWSQAILKDSSIGTIDDRMAILRNAAEVRSEMNEV